ncbi:MAG: hypothetical protein ACTSV3_06205 [Candidatus Thorarchaeota archaeon]|nr:MAG: hypothetical protein DRP09_09640 [Candidatus Thorarchaeota archaeon]RLI58339.1 MAG: hypothetical protein DRO87_06015 [Candidatus Thorarchaeota archaeon]
MRAKLGTILLVSLIVVNFTLPALAQSNHSLEWGVEVGEGFTYVLQRAYFASDTQRDVVEIELPYLTNLDVGQKATLVVDRLDTIPETIDSRFDMPVSSCNLTRQNDSVVIGTELERFLIPVGDWTFLAEVGNITGTPGLTLIDTADEWGTVGTGSYVDSIGNVIDVYIEMRYEKENGTLSYMRYHYSTGGADLFDIIFVHWYPGMPTILEGEIDVATVLVIALVSVVGVIMTVLTYNWYRGKKPLVQQLGE